LPDFLRIHGEPTSPTDLPRFHCIHARLPNSALFRWLFEKDETPVQIDVHGFLTLDETSLVRIAALEGKGLVYIMEADVREDIATGWLVRVLTDWTLSLAPLALYCPGRKKPPPAFSAFITAAREFARASCGFPALGYPLCGLICDFLPA
jgi:DNA-binding transcriptional LysR family regulator